jgi:hypothetical protein
MKEKSNSLYKLINEQKAFMKEAFILFPRASGLDTNYFMLIPRNGDRSVINTEYGELNAIGYHITVFDKLKESVKHSTFHITICLVDDNKKNFIARIFYRGFGTPIFYTIKDTETNLVNLGSGDELLAFGTKNIDPFIQRVLSLQQNYKVQFQELSNKFIAEQNILAEIRDGFLEDLLKYKESVIAIIAHIKSEPLFNHEYLPTLKWYKKALAETENKLNFLISTSLPKPPAEPVIFPAESESIKARSTHSKVGFYTPKNSPSSTKSTVKKEVDKTRVLVNELHEKMAAVMSSKTNDLDKIIQEYELIKQKVSLLLGPLNSKGKKVKKSQDDVELLDTEIRCNQLLEQIDSILLKAFNDEICHEKDDVLLRLLQHSSLKTQMLIGLAVNNNRPRLLELVLGARRDFKLDFKTQIEKQYLLEIAYNKGYLAVFQCLLAHNASPNIQVGAKKQPLLNRVCFDGRTDEMEALLEAHANPLVLDASGFAPLGILIMREPCCFNNIPMANVFLTYAPHAMEQLQGWVVKKCTPLTYACQNNDRDAVELLLKFGADPNNVREDNISAFGVCVYKENFELFIYLVEKSTVPISKGLFNALDLAVFCKLPQFIEYIIEYSDKHQLNLSIPSAEAAEYRLKKLDKSVKKYSFQNDVVSFFSQNLLKDFSNEDELQWTRESSVNGLS